MCLWGSKRRLVYIFASGLFLKITNFAQCIVIVLQTIECGYNFVYTDTQSQSYTQCHSHVDYHIIYIF